MSSSTRRLTGVAGRWSAAHPWTAITVWIGVVAALMVTGHLAGTLQLPYGAQNVGPSGQAQQMISRDFSRHATLSMIQLKQMGVGLAVAVLLDATVVRAVLLPATMKLLGPRNWYLPRWLGWLPRPSRPAPPPVPPSVGPPPLTRVGA
jgi:uncharacterized membrane protein YdfJ with MMPL/SSD domain